MTSAQTNPGIDIDKIAARNQTARRMLAGFAAEMPALADFWRALDTALADALALAAEAGRLAAELAAARMEGANLAAAVLATLAAHASGEADPLYYIRDEMEARQELRERHRRPA